MEHRRYTTSIYTASHSMLIANALSLSLSGSQYALKITQKYYYVCSSPPLSFETSLTFFISDSVSESDQYLSTSQAPGQERCVLFSIPVYVQITHSGLISRKRSSSVHSTAASDGEESIHLETLPAKRIKISGSDSAVTIT